MTCNYTKCKDFQYDMENNYAIEKLEKKITPMFVLISVVWPEIFSEICLKWNHANVCGPE